MPVNMVVRSPLLETRDGQLVVADRLPVRFQLQLHKLLWGEEQGR